MAKGYERNSERINLLNSFGKDLARRAKSKCELCGMSGVALKIYEIPPVEAEPYFEDCLMICDNCQENISDVKRFRSDYWRCLSTSIWSDNSAVQALSIRLLTRVAKRGENWAEELIEEAYVDEEITNWAASCE